MLTIIIITAIIILLILYNPGAALSSAREGLNLFMQSVLPAALPMFILTGVLQRLGALRSVGKLLEKPVRFLLHCPGDAAPVLLIAYICGTPTGSCAIERLYSDGVISRAQATRLAAASTTVSPGFIIAAVGVGLLGNAGAGYVMAIAHLLGALLNGVLFNLYKDAQVARAAAPQPKEGPLDAFTGAARDGAAAIWVVGAIIILCSAIAGVLEQWMPSLGVWIRGALEVTTGANTAAQLALPMYMKILIIEFILSFSGLSIHAQALAMLGGAINAPLFVLSKITHAIIATALCAAMLPLVHYDAAVFNTYAYNPMLVRDALLVTAVFITVCAVGSLGMRRN